jgi:hypothetical protein
LLRRLGDALHRLQDIVWQGQRNRLRHIFSLTQHTLIAN